MWKKRETDREAQDELIEKITARLSEKERESCEGKITLTEIGDMKKKMKKNKSAGIDGVLAKICFLG